VKSQSIVVVDDEEDLCRILEIALRINDFKVHLAHNGQDGLALVRKVRPLLLITDVKMPKMNGYELVQAIRSDNSISDTKIIMITSLTEDTGKTDEQWRDSLGVDGFFTKPYETAKLIKAVEDLVRPTTGT
jgi:two-component system chemotaxis response regulator CheY